LFGCIYGVQAGAIRYTGANVPGIKRVLAGGWNSQFPARITEQNQMS